ncbi:MAG: hypothetical protein II350_10105, partial [Clostridia bacterium]|nr:hypothetical protein [Clostridia bacterium]
PENAYIPPKTAEILDKFVAAGGKVFRSADSLNSEISVEGNFEGLRTCRRKLGKGELLLLFREDGENGEYRISVSAEKIFELSLENGGLRKLTAENGVLEISLAMGETAVLLLNGAEFEAKEKKRFSREFEIKDPFVLAKKEKQICSDKGFETVLFSEAPAETALGSWNGSVGEEFSGSCVYETEFSVLSEFSGKCCELDLGKVSYTAKVEFNGVDLGAVLASPYRFEVPANIIKEQNKLQITVVNTIANWYAHTDYFDRWEKNQLSPYFDGERNYAADYADGGLYGPVKICFE